jgi:hypothetical protein
MRTCRRRGAGTDSTDRQAAVGGLSTRSSPAACPWDVRRTSVHRHSDWGIVGLSGTGLAILVAASLQVSGRFRWWWQVLDSNQRSLRDGLQTGATSVGKTTADLRKRRHRGCPAAPSVRQTSVPPEAVSVARDAALHGCQHATVCRTAALRFSRPELRRTARGSGGSGTSGEESERRHCLG